tara:strand:- start:567 stop:1073 length:507 start_codon:yes stop_codon:yes gene_type:complete
MAENNQTEEQREEARQVARANLDNSYLTGLATSKIGKPENYGRLLGGIYKQTISTAPDQETYEQLFLPGLNDSESGVTINENYLKTQATAIIQESLFTLPVDEILEGMGINPEVAKTYSERSMEDLSDEEKGSIFSTYMTNMVEEEIEQRLPEMRESRINALEKALTQ